jgi:LacI family transcriptional regulator
MTRTRPATLIEVAERAGVSLTTASKAINGKTRVSEETRARVMAVARELSFTPNPIARGLMTGRTSTVGLVIADSLSHRFAVPVMLGAEAALSEIDLSMITCDARGDRDRSRDLVRMLQARKVDGVLVIGDNNGPTHSVTHDVNIPIVYLYGESDDSQDVVHTTDDRGGSAMVVDHLVDTGRRRIAHLTGPKRATAVTERVAGISASLRRHHLKLAAPIVYGEWSQRWARTATADLIARVPDIDAVLCGSDQIASGVLVALDELGLRVPDDIAVTGYDNWRVFAEETVPQLTTVDMKLEELGAAAAGELFAIIDGAPHTAGVRRHSCELIVRGSTAASTRSPGSSAAAVRPGSPRP